MILKKKKMRVRGDAAEMKKMMNLGFFSYLLFLRILLNLNCNIYFIELGIKITNKLAMIQCRIEILNSFYCVRILLSLINDFQKFIIEKNYFRCRLLTLWMDLLVSNLVIYLHYTCKLFANDFEI